MARSANRVDVQFEGSSLGVPAQKTRPDHTDVLGKGLNIRRAAGDLRWCGSGIVNPTAVSVTASQGSLLRSSPTFKNDSG
jgi:hypothetical protein